MSAPTTTDTLDVQGMDCASCAAAIEVSLRKLNGVRDVAVNVVGGTVRVGYPLAAAVVGGLLSSTALTLLLLPTLYGWFEQPGSRQGPAIPKG